jgi:2,6-dihydroxypyridine 3-monooxygenase
MTLEVGIVGGSLGGLNAALWLRHIGCNVTIFERAPQLLTGLGAGIVLNPATVRWFVTQDGPPVDAISVASQYVRYIDFRGNVIAERDEPYRFSSYNALYRGLLDAFERERYLLGQAVTYSGTGVTHASISLAGGGKRQFDMVVCADGIRSHNRQELIQLMPALAPQYAGYVAWRGMVRAEDVPAELFNQLFNAITYHVMPFGHMLTYPIPVVDRESSGGLADGVPYLNWLWYRNVEAGDALDTLMTDRDGVRRDLSLGPGMVRDDAVMALWQDAEEHLPPVFATLISRTAQPFVQVIVDCEPPRMAEGRLCRIGDAAFVARPHAAAGTAKAAEDGYQLAQMLLAHDFDVREALKTWEAGQLALGQQILARTRQAGDALQHARWEVGAPLPFGLYVSGDSCMP